MSGIGREADASVTLTRPRYVPRHVTMNEDFIRAAGAPFLAHRLKRLSDQLVADIASVLETLELTVPATAGSTLLLLSEHDRLGVMEIAERLRVTHPFIVRLVSRLESLELVCVTHDASDLRRKWVTLTAKGTSEASVLKRLNSALERVLGSIATEAGADLLGCVSRFESELETKSLSDRLTSQFSTGVAPCVG